MAAFQYKGSFQLLAIVYALRDKLRPIGHALEVEWQIFYLLAWKRLVFLEPRITFNASLVYLGEHVSIKVCPTHFHSIDRRWKGRENTFLRSCVGMEQVNSDIQSDNSYLSSLTLEYSNYTLGILCSTACVSEIPSLAETSMLNGMDSVVPHGMKHQHQPALQCR